MTHASPPIASLVGELAWEVLHRDDGVRLAYQQFGDPRRPAVVLANGIGVSFVGMLLQIAALRPRYRVICWDYLGVGGSTPAPPDADVSIERHAADALAILDALGIERAMFVGWSMGVQVSLEVARRAPGRLAGLVALCGTYATPFRTAFPMQLAQGLEAAFGWLSGRPQLAQAALDLAVTMPSVAFTVLQNAMFVGPDAHREIFAGSVSSVAQVDKRIYLRTMMALAAHDARDVLPRVSCPALVIAGRRDRLTPPEAARQMVAELADASYLEVEGSHFALIERPQLINDALLRFAERVYGKASQEH